jgi:hypothetical protein
VNSVKELNLYGGGGTAMEVSVDYVASLPAKERPDIFVLATDGGTDWNAFERSCLEIYTKVKIVVLVTSEYGWKIVPESLKDLVTMIDVTGKYPISAFEKVRKTAPESHLVSRGYTAAH